MNFIDEFVFLNSRIKIVFGHFRWILLLFIVTTIVAIAVAAFNKSKSTCDNCNVILVSLDTLSALHLPCYGYERNTAPNLCAFAKKNLLFTNSFSHSPTTLDSHFSIFTSLYPHTHKMKKISGPPLDEKYLTLAQVMRNNGYDTIYHGTLSDLHLPLDKGIERGFNVIHGNSHIDSWGESYKLLEENTKKNKKTFLFLHSYDAHDPYLTGHKKKHLYTDQKEYSHIPLVINEYTKITPEYLDFVVETMVKLVKVNNYKTYTSSDVKIVEEIKKAKTFDEKQKIYNKLSIPYKEHSLTVWAHAHINSRYQAQIDYLEALYDEKINQLDKELKKLIQLVEDPKYSKNTILVITADHGEEFMEHGYLYHAQHLYSTSTKVPLIIHIPDTKPKKIEELVQGIDIYPTILSSVGLKPESHTEGIDLTGIIRGDKNAITNKYLLSEFRRVIGIQVQNWRFYYDSLNKKSLGLYNLDVDPIEQKNLIQNNRAKVGELIGLIEKLNISFD